jgi:hypothetical protein
MYVILFITHHRYHSLTYLKTTTIEIQGIKIIFFTILDIFNTVFPYWDLIFQFTNINEILNYNY